MPAIEHGTVRQVWFAPKANPNDKSSFLIRDDAYSKQGMTQGRTVRLGDPVDLGPYSTWRQTTWVGGEGQEFWRDPEMYHKGAVDTYRTNGKAKLHRALGDIDVNVVGRGVTQLTLGRNTTVVDRTTPVILQAGECNYYDNGATPAGGYCMYAAKRGFPTLTLKTDLDASVMSMSPIADSYKGIFVGLSNGKVWDHVSTGNNWNLEHTFSSGSPVYSIDSFSNATYFACGDRVFKRTFDGTTHKYVEFFRPPGGKLVRGMAVWNNRLWFASMSYGRTTTVYVTDGVFTVPAFTFPGEFECFGMVPYQGSLYCHGSRPGGDSVSFQGQMWRYSGSSLTLLHKQGTGRDGFDHTIWDAAVNEDTLYWTRSGFADNDYTAGLNAYRAETDAILTGPVIRSWTTATQVRSVDLWDQTVACSIYNAGVNTAVVRPASADEAVTRSTATVTRELRSSVYDAELSNQVKTWYRARLRVKIPAGTSLVLKVIPDENNTPVTVGTIAHDAGNLGWRVVTLPITAAGGDYLQATSLQYVVEFTNSSGVSGSLANPELDSVEIDFMPTPQRKRQWRVRVYAADAQKRLDGTANPLATRSAVETKLEDYWASGSPVLFWDATAASGVPGGTPAEVIFTEFMVQSYRVDSVTEDVASEVSLGFYEGGV